MAINWNAYEAAKELYGNNKENIADIGSRFPLFSRSVAMVNNEHLLDILGAIPKVTARVIETGLKELEGDNEEFGEDEKESEAVKEEKPKAEKKSATKTKKEETKEEETDYDSMNAKELYALCCERHISSKLKSRSKSELVKALVAYDNGEFEEEEEKETKKPAKKAEEKKAKKQTKKEESEEESWDDEEDSDPYAGKTAKELFMMCKERGIKAQPKKEPSFYADLLKKDDAKNEEPEEADDDEDWEF